MRRINICIRNIQQKASLLQNEHYKFAHLNVRDVEHLMIFKYNICKMITTRCGKNIMKGVWEWSKCMTTVCVWSRKLKSTDAWFTMWWCAARRCNATFERSWVKLDGNEESVEHQFKLKSQVPLHMVMYLHEGVLLNSPRTIFIRLVLLSLGVTITKRKSVRVKCTLKHVMLTTSIRAKLHLNTHISWSHSLVIKPCQIVFDKQDINEDTNYTCCTPFKQYIHQKISN